MSSPIATILANLRSTVNTMRHAVYAIDVRDDIADAIDDSADAIEQIYEDVNSPTLREEGFAAALQEAIDDNLLPIPASVIDDNSLPGTRIQEGSLPLDRLASPVQITVDSALSDSSTNPVQNKVVTFAISELNGSLETLTGKEVTGTFVAKKYLVTDPSQVSQVDIASPVTNNSWSYKRLSVNPGEEYTLTVYGGATPRAWCVTDNEYNILITSDSGAVLLSEVVKIPSNGAYLILNHRTDKGVTESVIKGRTLDATTKQVMGLRLSEDFRKAFSDVLDILAYDSTGQVKDKVAVLKNSLSGAIYNSNMYVPIDYNLANVSSSNDALEVSIGASFTTTLTIDTDCSIYDLSVKMGGMDITATAYNANTHVISIASVTDAVKITALATSDYEKDTKSVYGDIELLGVTVTTFAKKNGTGDNTMVVPGVYYEKRGAFNCSVAYKRPFGSCIVNEDGDAPTDYYLIKIPTDAVGVRVESTPTETQLQVRVHPLTENGLIDNYTMGGNNTTWRGSTVSYNFDEATLTALAGYGAGLWVHTRHGSTATSANRYDLHPELIPKVKITFLKQE